MAPVPPGPTQLDLASIWREMCNPPCLAARPTPRTAPGASSQQDQTKTPHGRSVQVLAWSMVVRQVGGGELPGSGQDSPEPEGAGARQAMEKGRSSN